MTRLDDLATKSTAKAKGRRPYFFDDPAVDRLLAITMALAGELSVTRDRLDTMERLLDRNNLLDRDDIEGFVPSDEEAAERGRRRDDYIARVLRIIEQEREALETDEDYEAVVRQVADA